MTEMQQELPTPIVTIGESYGKRAPNFTIENARFFGKPNFSGELDRFKDDRRKFTVIIPDEAVVPLQQLGYNVKTTVPDAEAVEQGREPINHLKVILNFSWHKDFPGVVEQEKGPDVWIIQGEDREKLTSRTVGLIDRSRFEQIDMEIRGWEYDPEEQPGMLSARLVMFVGVMRPSIIGQKYDGLR
jgi:hypothetical protein